MTIEERAEKKALRMVHPNSFSRPTTKELLVEMAKEQLKIDIEKVYHALEMVVSKKVLEDLKKILEE